MNLKDLYNEVDISFSRYEDACKKFEDEIFRKFDFSLSVVFQYSDGFVLAWEDEDGEYNSSLIINELSKISNRKDFIKYLKDNTIS